MKSNLISRTSILLAGFLAVVGPDVVRADRLAMNDGTQVEGTIKKVSEGQVTVEVGSERKCFNILDVASMDFDVPQAPFAQGVAASAHEAEITGEVQDVDKSAAQVRSALDQVKRDWAGRKAIATAEEKEWAATREHFNLALSRYQEVLNDVYFRVLGKVDEYNALANDGGALYVGVKGALNVGSPLVSREMKQLPLKKFVPANWYNKIFYDGYWAGYREGYRATHGE